jgi:membrane associated rhomboid family serine protease
MAQRRRTTLPQASQASLSFVFLLVFVQLGDLLLQLSQPDMTLKGFGIRPREPLGLIGVAFSPLLHGDWLHLAANAIPLSVLMTLLFWDRRYHPSSTLILIWLLSGLGTWAIGQPGTLHVGASSLVYGLAAYLTLAGLLMRSWRAFFIALVVALTFSGIWYGALPQDGPVSWEGHLCGGVAGLLAAWGRH